MKAKITSFTFLLFILSILIVKAQFPAPVNFDLQPPNIGIDNIFYLSWDPPAGNVGYYKIFRNNLLIDSCYTTTYQDTVEFYYICKYNLSAVYFDPPGASNPDSCCAVNIVLDIIKSPFIEEFESFFYHTWGNITEHGKGSWFLSNADYHSGSQSVKFNGLQEGDSALPKDFSFSERSILILPNPYRDNLTVFIESKEETILQFDLINSIGQIIYSEHLRVYQGDNVYNFNINNSPKGIQIAKFHNSEFSSNVILIKD